jgi:hypothetical protein
MIKVCVPTATKLTRKIAVICDLKIALGEILCHFLILQIIVSITDEIPPSKRLGYHVSLRITGQRIAGDNLEQRAQTIISPGCGSKKVSGILNKKSMPYITK